MLQGNLIICITVKITSSYNNIFNNKFIYIYYNLYNTVDIQNILHDKPQR